MWSLRLVARVPPEKRLEFTQSVQTLLRTERARFRQTLVLQDVDDRSIFCWMADGDASGGLQSFIGSASFHALKGAAEVLGTIEELRMLHEQPTRRDEKS